MLEISMNFQKLKYVILDEIFKKHIKVDIENLNFFIDLRSVLSKLYIPSNIETFSSLNVSEKYLISSELLNFISHYRHYCYSRLGKYSTFYYFYSDVPECTLQEIYPDYKKDYYERHFNEVSNYFYINEVVEKNIKILSTIIDYIPHAYFINSKHVEPSSFLNHIKDIETSQNVYLSSDEVILQSVLFNDNNIAMILKGDDSQIINQDNLIDYYLRKSKKEVKYSFTPNLYLYLLSISGVSKYNIDGIKGYGPIKTVKLLDKLISEGYLNNINYLNEDMFINDIKNSNTLNEEQLNIIKRNYNLLNITKNYNNIKEIDKIKLFDEAIVDRIDAIGVKYINEKYYQKYPIYLDYLMEGEAYE